MTPSELQTKLHYCPATGQLTWLPRKPNEHWANQWNSRFAGKPAFTTDHGDGYLCGVVGGKQYLTHRVCWAIHHGSWPVNDIDHRDGNGTNNRILNLRDVTEIVNGQNKAAPSKKSAFPVGVSFDKRSKLNPYRAKVMDNGKQVHIGNFPTIAEASQAYQQKIRALGFTQRHGT